MPACSLEVEPLIYESVVVGGGDFPLHPVFLSVFLFKVNVDFMCKTIRYIGEFRSGD